MVYPRIMSTDVDDFRFLATFGEYQVMTQPMPRELSITPLIIRDFRGCPLLLAGSNLASATLNHQNWTRAITRPNRGADSRIHQGGIKESGSGRELSSSGIKEFVNMKTVDVR
jgi:hypothetical protein